MSLFTVLDIASIILTTIHFGTPLAYYLYIKRYLDKPWSIDVDDNYEPRVTIIVPTYNEARLIEKKLDNLYQQNYSRNKLEIIVVDSASSDGTPELIKKWAEKHPDIDLNLVEEPVRRGMVPALNYVLKNFKIDSEITIFTDVDAFWEPDTLKRIARYFADPKVGAVTASIVPENTSGDFLESSYRSYYNVLRVAESKIHSTAVHNGALVAFRTELLYKIGGLPEYTGNNDSTPASIVAFMGYRAIQVDDVVVKEPVRRDQLRRKIRRAQHLVLHFLKTKRYVKKLGLYNPDEKFENIWRVEWWLHIANPWLLLIALTLFIVSALYGSIIALVLLGTGLALLTLKHYKTWVLQQLYLITGTVRNLWTKEIAWSK
ncbi:MAG: glycosyltransferase family 2 protein [Thermoprotei archaeon]|nr:MAG: glycosyltransferase family 2 protein [Thermoprotei archaeon]